MELCGRGHNTVCFESRDCPVCAEYESKLELEAGYKEQIRELEREIDNLQEEIAALNT